MMIRLCLAWLLITGLVLAAEPSLPENARNTEPASDLTPPEKALQGIKLPDGFRASLFAHEPFVSQPISIAFDDRGRLWVAECYSYESSGGNWDQPIRDRILIFTDEDNDGQFDQRKVFTDKVSYVTSVLPGMGGVWVCATPKLLFIPDRDRDDVPDGEPEVVLDGWDNGRIGHCVFNGLKWGPDGWLWGRQGLQGTSKVGKVGADDAQRTKFNGGIWRYHPVQKQFDVVCEGATNPWGLDFDDHGQAFFTNCVIGHLWHVIPGAHYERMYGKDFTPYTYGLIKQCADHLHWNAKKWTDARSGQEQYGGGHAHCGGMIYLGNNWPKEYRGRIFMNNIHGRRVNSDILVRHGSGYLGKHGPDFLTTTDPWFRGIAIEYGPDGGVFVVDWSDVGECHDNNAVHRESGRIYKVTYGPQRELPAGLDLQTASNDDLVKYQLHKNDWYVRHARRVLQERAIAGQDMKDVHDQLQQLFSTHPLETRRLRALWALYVTGGLRDDQAVSWLDDQSEHVRAWLVRLMVDDRKVSAIGLARMEDLADDESPLVRLYVAAALQRIPVADRVAIALKLVARGEDQADANLPLMIWYGIEPIVASDRTAALKLLSASKINTVRTYIARRLAE